MTTTSFLTQEAQTMLEPDEDIMLMREGWDRRGIRRDIAPTTAMDRGERYVEEGAGVYAAPHADMPETTTAVGEVLGNVDVVRYTGDQIHVPRMTHGLTVDAEDLEVDGAQDKVDRSQSLLFEQFDIQADLQFLLGITDEEGNQVQPGVFEWLDNNIDSANVINAGDAAFDDYRLSNDGQPSNIIQSEAYGNLTGEYAQDGWDFAMYKHNVRALWNTIDANSGVSLQSQWVDLGADNQGVGSSVVNDTVLIPDSTGLRTAPDDTSDALNFDITFPTASNGSDDDVMYLIPDHGGDFFQMYEQPEPTLIQDPIRKDGGKTKWEYYWRAGQAFGFGSHRTDDGSGGNTAIDAVKIENVSTLF